MAKKKPVKKKLSPFQTGSGAEPPKYTISRKVQAILDDPELDSAGLTMRDRAVLVLELGKRLVTQEDETHHMDYLRHADPLVTAGPKTFGWVYDAVTGHLDENIANCPYNWFPAIPFIFSDDPDTVDDACRLVCIHHPGSRKDPILGPKIILGSLVGHLPKGKHLRGAQRKAFHVALAYGIAAVLECGDLRLLPALNAAWDSIDDEVRATLIERFGGRVTELQVEFYLSILERSKPTSTGFELAALHLLHCVKYTHMPIVRFNLTIDRVRFDFGLHKSMEEETVVAETPVRKYLAKIAPRLRALEPRAPNLIAGILDSWQKAA